MFGRDSNGEARLVVAACEALIEGRYVEQLEAWGRPVPPWAWMNLLAHGPAEALRKATIDRSGRRFRRAELWHQARSYLAGEILDAAPHLGTLHAMQAEILIPLELELMLRRRSGVRAPGQWVTWVTSAIDGHRPMQSHR